MDKIKLLKDIIDKSKDLAVFTGAGVSVASGLKDFRGKDGLYKEKLEHSPEYYLSHSCFQNKPELFFNFYKTRMNSLKAEPNILHKYFSNLENSGKKITIITQNIDGLHSKAGSKNVLEIHGTIMKNHCTRCYKEYGAEDIFNSNGIPRCTCGGIIKPDVTLYEEMLPNDFIKALKVVGEADTLLVIGSSLTVEPAASLVRYFIGDTIVIINGSSTPYDSFADLIINENITEVFKKISKVE